MRIDFKQDKVQESKFFNFCKENEADYFETTDNYGVWIVLKKYGATRLGIKLREDGIVDLVEINDATSNINNICNGHCIYKEEQIWMLNIFKKFEKYTP